MIKDNKITKNIILHNEIDKKSEIPENLESIHMYKDIFFEGNFKKKFKFTDLISANLTVLSMPCQIFNCEYLPSKLIFLRLLKMELTGKND